MFSGPARTNAPPNLRLDNLGRNREGRWIRALAMDSLFLCPPSLEMFNVKPRTHHRLRFADVLHADGSAVSRSNRDGRYTVDLHSYAELHDAFNRILGVLEKADAQY